MVVERRGRAWTKNMYERPTDEENGVRMDRGSRGGWVEEEKEGEDGTTVIE